MVLVTLKPHSALDHGASRNSVRTESATLAIMSSN